MNKKILFAGIAGLISLTAVSLASASDVNVSGTTATPTMTKQSMLSRMGQKVGKMVMKGRMMNGGKEFNSFIGFGPGMMGHGMGMMKFGAHNEAITTALKNNDYNAFVTARNADTKKPAKATVPTKEEFAKMVTMYQKGEAIRTAIENNDYNAFVTATTPTQEQFNEIVKKAQEMKAKQTTTNQ